MKKVLNPFAGENGHNCFGCSPVNPIGLKLTFETDNEKVYCKWKPDGLYQGYKNVLHGGIQATLMDEIAAWTVYTIARTSGVTSGMNLKYHRPCLINDAEIFLEAKIKEITGKKASIIVSLFDANRKLCTEGEIYYYIFDLEKAVNKYKYPGKEKFFE